MAHLSAGGTSPRKTIVSEMLIANSPMLSGYHADGMSVLLAQLLKSSQKAQGKSTSCLHLTSHLVRGGKRGKRSLTSHSASLLKQVSQWNQVRRGCNEGRVEQNGEEIRWGQIGSPSQFYVSFAHNPIKCWQLNS